MKEIYILRHAKSSWDNINLADFDRPLAKKGIDDAKKLCSFLKKHKFNAAKVICSNAKRAKETFDLTADGFQFLIDDATYTDDLYFGNIDTVIEKIKETEEELKNILIVGHNPTLHLLVENLIDKNIQKFSTCNLAIISFKDKWKNLLPHKCKLKSLIRPKEIKF
jgi:phosphohistidine phosphatase